MTIDDAREDFMNDVYNTLDFLPTNNEANRIIDSFDRVTSGLEQQPCEDWYDVPSNEMTLEQARQAVKDLRKKLAEYLEKQPCDDCISRKDMLAVLRQSHSLTQAWEGFEKLPSVTPKGKTEYEHDHEVVKAYNDGQAYILDKINTEIKETANKIRNIRNDNLCFFTEQDVLEIIEKYRKVSK